MVDESDRDVTGLDCFEHVAVAGDVGDRLVGDQVLEPRPSGVLALAGPEAGDERLEAGVRRHDRHLTSVLGVSELFDADGGVGQVRVVDDDTGAAGDADPLVVALGPEPLVDRPHQLVGQRGEESGLGEHTDRPDLLGIEHVGGGVLALLEQLGAHLGGVAVADVDLDAGVVGELLDEGRDEFLVAAGVERDGLARHVAGGAVRGVVGRGGVVAAGGEQGGERKQGEQCISTR